MSQRFLASLCASSLLFLACETLLDDPAGLHADHTHHRELAEQSVGAAELARDWAERSGYLVSPVLVAPEGATRVSALVTLVASDVPAPLFEARGLDEDGHPGPWRALEMRWAEQELFVAHVDLDFLAQAAELRIPADSLAALAGLTWSAIVPLERTPEGEPTEPGIAVDEVGRATQALSAELSSAGVLPRSSWEARPSLCSASEASKNRITIHHTVTPATSDPAVRLRGLQAYQMDSLGWCDIGYHLLISLDGQVWEGRDAESRGDHVAGQDTGNLGIAYIGCFHTSGCSDWAPFTPPEAMIQSGADMVRTAAQIYGIAIDSDTVKGHRDQPGQTTSCPGDGLSSQLNRIRALASLPFDGDAGDIDDAPDAGYSDDAGFDSDDAGFDSDDAGVDSDDAGVDSDDAGVDRDDAGVDRDDAGVDRDDAGVDRDDDGEPPPPGVGTGDAGDTAPPVATGCSCSGGTSDSLGGVLFALAALAFVRRRRARDPRNHSP